MKEKIKSYRFPLILLGSIIMGSIVGLISGETAAVLEPFGDIFLNLLFMIVIPLVFFSISSAIANMNSMRRLGKIMGSMMAIFIITGIIASVFMLFAAVFSLPDQGQTFRWRCRKILKKFRFLNRL